MKTFKEKHQELYDDIVSLFRDKVDKIGKYSDDNNDKTIEIKNMSFQFNIKDSYMYITEIGKDYFYSKYGYIYSFDSIEFSDLVSLADYVNEL